MSSSSAAAIDAGHLAGDDLAAGHHDHDGDGDDLAGDDLAGDDLAGDDLAADADPDAGAVTLAGWNIFDVAELAGTSTRAVRLAIDAGVLRVVRFSDPPLIDSESADRFAAACRANQEPRVAAVASDLTAQGYRRPYQIAADAGVDADRVLYAIARGTLQATPRGRYLMVSRDDAAHYVATIQARKAA